MTNARLIVVNAASRSKSFSAINGFAGELVASMLNDIKTDVYRSAGKTDEFAMAWDAPEVIESMHWVWVNWSPTTEVRVYGYSDEAGVNQVYYSGPVYPCPAPSILLRAPWTQVTSASAYKHGGGAHGRIWMPKGTTVRKLKWVVTDNNNVQGYIECGRVVAGKYYEVEYNPEYGAPISFASLSKQTRDGDTNMRVQVGGKFKKQQIVFAAMDETDRDFMIDLFLANGIEVPFIFALYPNSADLILERTHLLYAHLVEEGSINIPSFRKWATGLTIEAV